MITSEQARAICYGEINCSDPYWPEKPEMVVTQVDELASAWIVYYTSSAFLKSGSTSDAIAGNGPFVILKNSGRFVATGTGSPLERRIQEALKLLEVAAP